MSRFTDDYPFFGEPETGPPATVNVLLNRLGVSFAPVSEQRDAVAGWLKTNKPSPVLAAELQHRQLADVVTTQR